MKIYIKRYSYTYVIISLIFIIISLGIRNRLNYEVSFIRLSFANVFITAFISLAWSVFMMNKWNSLVKIILAFVSLLPIIILFKRAFGSLLFKASFAIYIFALIVAIVYGIAVMIVSTKAKNDEKYLNKLLNDNKKNL